MKSDAQPIRFAGSELRHSRHVCAFFNSEDEQYRVLLPFIRDGLAAGEMAVHVLCPCCHQGHVDRLGRAGIEVQPAIDSGQLSVLSSIDAYLHNGSFDQDRMIGMFERMASAEPAGLLTRFVCQMEWAVEDGRNCIDDVIEFESRVNDVWATRDDAVICVYDLARFSGEAVVDIMRTHPMIIIGGVLQENPFYTPPAQFLSELRARRGGIATIRGGVS